MRRTIGGALLLSLGLALFYVVLQVERGERRGSKRAPGPVVEHSEPLAELDVVEREAASATADGHDAADREEHVVAAAPATQGMRLVVRDAVDERPIAGALVRLFDRATPLALRTGRDGVCVVPVLSFEEPELLRVEAAGHFHWSQTIVPAANLTVALPRSAILGGRVLAADTGGPVAGAELALLHAACSGCQAERQLSAADGRYELPGVPLRREAALEVRAEGFAPARRVFELRSDEPRVTQDIRLVRGLELSGRVEDWTNGRGLAGARVGELVADEDGLFQGRILARPATGRASFEARAPGYASLNVVLAGPSEEELVLRLPQLAFLEGRVTDSAGQPLVGAIVSFVATGPNREAPIAETSPLYELPEGWSYSTESTEARSDVDGGYSLAVLPWSLNCIVRAQERGFLDGEASLESIGEPASKLRMDWWLKPGVEPTVVHGTVTFNGQAREFGGMVTWRGPTRSGSGHVRRGSYGLEVEPGEVGLSAVLDFAPAWPSSEFVVELAPGAERRIDLDVVTPTATITGSVRFGDGTPLAGRAVMAILSLLSDGMRSLTLYHQAVTDERGEFTLHVDDVGLLFEVNVRDFDGSTLSQPGIAPGASGVDFELVRGYRVFVRLREASTGAALRLDHEVQVLARGKPGQGFWRLNPVSLLPDADGWYECGTTARELDLLALPRTAELPLYGTLLLPRVRLDGPTPARVEFVLERGLEVALELAEGVAPWPDDHDLLLLDEELWSNVYRPRGRNWETPFNDLEAQCSVRFDAAGRAVVRGLAPGNYRFKPRPGDLVVDPEFVRVECDALPVLVRWARRE